LHRTLDPLHNVALVWWTSIADIGATALRKSVILQERAEALVPAFEGDVRYQELVWTFYFCALLAVSASAQHQDPSASQQGSKQTIVIPSDSSVSASTNEAERGALKEMQKRANLERQAALKKDTDRLLQLAEELKSSVDKSNASILSLDVMKKAEQIEKLAHSVKDKMKGAN
jgi:hypothetical protein